MRDAFKSQAHLAPLEIRIEDKVVVHSFLLLFLLLTNKSSLRMLQKAATYEKDPMANTHICFKIPC